MSYYSPQARNGANLPHRVTFASFAEGDRIEGKLSDFKTKDTKHLWRDDPPRKIPETNNSEMTSQEIDEMFARIQDRKVHVQKLSRNNDFIMDKPHESYRWGTARQISDWVNIKCNTISRWIHDRYIKNIIPRNKKSGYLVTVEEVMHVYNLMQSRKNNLLTSEQKRLKQKAARLAYTERRKILYREKAIEYRKKLRAREVNFITTLQG